jgi:hypothetical protein
MEDTYHLPLIKKCVDRSTEYEKAGDTINAEKWFNLAIKAEKYYAKQNYKIAEDYYKEIHGT